MKNKDIGKIKSWVCLGINSSKLSTYVKDNKKVSRLDEAGRGPKIFGA